MFPSTRFCFSACVVAVFILTACGSSQPTVSRARESFADSTDSIDPSRELLITDLSVVNDGRTVYRAHGRGDPTSDAWSFGRLMENMSGDHAVSDFVLRWLRSWETDQLVNGFTAPSRPNIRSLVIDP